jgi:crotonobetainyl-CoA:carnitine CoA-transferase CaiB-like acyl-CoA transferase
VHVLSPQVLDYTVREHVPQRMANRSLRDAPHGVFPVAGQDVWIAIACATDAQWQSLVQVMGSPAWAVDAQLASAAGRLAAQDALERRLAEWTASQPGDVLQHRLLEAGIPAGVAYPMLDVFQDPQLVHRRHFVPLDHPEMGVWNYDELGFKLPESPSQLRTAAPLLGQHTELVLKQFLGLSDAEYQALVDAGTLQ